MQLSSKAQLMTSFRGRWLLAAKTAAAEDPANNNSLLSDPWYAPTSRLKGRVDWDGCEYITSQHCLDAWKSQCTHAAVRCFVDSPQFCGTMDGNLSVSNSTALMAAVSPNVSGVIKKRPTACVSAHHRRVSRQNRHKHALRCRQDRFTPGNGLTLGSCTFGPSACCGT